MNYCDWCHEPAIDSVQVEPAQWRTTKERDAVTGKLIKQMVRRPISAWVCAEHAKAPGRGVDVERARRKKARAAQTTLFDFIPEGPGNAVHGLD
jgi:hypothetical protein